LGNSWSPILANGFDSSLFLAATDLVVRYNERTILDAATLGIDEGDRIGLVGRNGCGKTTFLKILAGLQSPDGGEVTARRDLVVSYLRRISRWTRRWTCAAMCARARGMFWI
jgi:ATPase subunit of ABC transporter with duplicated ATPase domains